MSNYNPAFDTYISKAQSFAQPILEHLRELVHQACPDVEEKMKWSFPHFDYKGEMMCSMASFKQHAVFGFWKAALMNDPVLLTNAKSEVSMGHLGKLTSLKDLPSDRKLISYIKEAMKLNEDGIKIVKKPPVKSTGYIVPDYITAAIKKNKKAFATFEAFSPSHRKEYATWIDEAKAEATKEKRIAQAIEWLAEGKQRHWKYK
jgi:uncharacterized protein YdeI (YjbR/CyaY-like superfamily)